VSPGKLSATADQIIGAIKQHAELKNAITDAHAGNAERHLGSVTMDASGLSW
jgi:hypothetical protein